MKQVLFYFSGAGNFCPVRGLRQLTRDVKGVIRTLIIRSDRTHSPPRKTPNDVRIRSFSNVKCQKYRNYVGKKKNKTLVSNADREIPTLGQRIIPETQSISFPVLSIYPQVEISWSASETYVRFYLPV